MQAFLDFVEEDDRLWEKYTEYVVGLTFSNTDAEILGEGEVVQTLLFADWLRLAQDTGAGE